MKLKSARLLTGPGSLESVLKQWAMYLVSMGVDFLLCRQLLYLDGNLSSKRLAVMVSVCMGQWA